MADDDHLNVDLDVGSNDLEAHLRRTFDLLQVGLQRAEGLRQAMDRSADAARRFKDDVAGLQAAAALAPAGSAAEKAAFDAIKARTEQQEKHNAAIREEIQLQRDANLARGAVRRTSETATLTDGRTAGQAQSAEGALRSAITGINTTADQLSARLAAATGKAMERLLTSTTTAIENSFLVAQQRQASRAAQLSVPGYLEARVTNDRVSAQLAVERAQQGGTLEERRARAARVAQLEVDRKEAERQERDYQKLRQSYMADEARQAAREADPNTALREANRNRSFRRQHGVDYDTYTSSTAGMSRPERTAWLDQQRATVDAGVRDLNEAYRLNREFDQANNRAWSDTVASAKAENTRRDRQMADAVRDNRGVDRDSRAAAEAENKRRDKIAGQADAENRRIDANSRAAAEAENRRRDRQRSEAEAENARLTRETRAAAEAENRRRDKLRTEADAENQRIERDARAAARAENARRDRQTNEAYRDNRGVDADARAAAKAENARRDKIEAQAWEENKRRDRDAYAAAQAENARRDKVAKGEQREARRAAGPDYDAAAERGFKARNAAFNLNGGADQFAFQAQLATNYALFGAVTGMITGAVGAIKEFDDVLSRFQAITGAATSEMGGFRAELLGIAKDSRFSVNELAQVAITLGQTGLSASDVAKALKPVADLAAASGSTLQQSVEAITGVLGAYGMAAGRAAEVSDILVGALNATKLTMEQLQLGIQYAANIARDSGVSFSELTATIGAISQAGVKSGSTIGTGIRQLITELTSPSQKFRDVLKELGISLADVDLRANGLSGVLKNLTSAGFTTADALRSLDLRAAAAFSAIGGQGDLIEKLRTQMLLSSAASEGAAKANESLTATLQRLGNTTFAVVDTAFKPLVDALKLGTEGLIGLVGNFEKLGPILPAVGAGLTAIVGTLALLKVGGLALGLLTSGFIGLPVLGVGAAAGIAYMVAQLVNMETALERVTKRLDQIKGVENELSSKRDSVTLTLTDIDRQIDGLIAKRDKLNEDPLQLQNAVIEAQKGFGDVGFSMDGVSKSADGLIAAYQRLRAEMQGKLPDLGMQQILATQEKLIQLAEKQKALAEQNRTQTAPVTAVDGFGRVIAGGDKFEPTAPFRALGGPFDRAMDVVENPSLISRTDPLGSTRGLRAQMLEAQGVWSQQLLDEKLKATADQDPGRVKELEAKVKLATEALQRFAQTADVAIERQAAGMELERRQDEVRRQKLEASPEVVALDRRADALKVQRASDQEAVLRAPGLSPDVRVKQLLATLRVTGDEAKGQLAELDGVRDAMLARGETKENIAAALAAVRGKLDAIAKNASKELRELIESLNPEAVRVSQAERRGNDAEIATLTKQAQTATSQADLERVTNRIKELTEANAVISREILTFGKTPEQIANDSGLQTQLDELDRETKAKLEKLQEDYIQRRRRIEDAVLRISANADKAREQELRAEASRLEKIAKDAQTTPEKARELVEQINKLLDEATTIAKGRVATDAQREVAASPNEILADSRTAPAGSVAERVITTARAAGAGSMVNYLLGLGQLESSMNPGAKNASGAKGLFQFMNNDYPGGVNTWGKYGKGDIFSVENQVPAAIDFTRDNAKIFRDRLGRDPTDAELFVLHNQGAAGGTRLLRNPNSPARDFVSAAAIENNGAKGRSGSITAGEFTEILKGMYATASRASEKLTTTTAKVLKDKEEADKGKLDKENAEDKRRVGAIEQQKADQALLASLRLQDKTETAGIAAAMARISKANEVATVKEASSGAIAAYGRLNASALKADELDANSKSRTPEQKEEGRTAITERFRALAEKEAIAAADAAGKVSTRVLDQEIARREAQLKSLKLDENENKVPQAEIDKLDQELVKLKERRALEGESASIREQIAVLEKALADAATAGLGPAEKQVLIQEKLLELKRKQALSDVSVNTKRDLDAKGPSMSNAVSGAIVDFEKARGIRDPMGKLVDETQEARKLLAGELNVIGNAFDNLFVNLFNGSMKAGDALKKFATDILGGLMQQISRSLTNSIFKSIFGGLEGGAGAGGGLFDGIGKFFSSIFGGGMASGGPIRMAGGGGVPGSDAALAQRDSKLILAQPGEYLLRRSAVDAVGRDTLDQVNALGNTMVNRAPKVDAKRMAGGASASANVYVVDRDQVPVPGASDFVFAIGENIQRGGTIKQLIKRVAAGG
ncbi:phage tail tape measure protein [Methylobacterium aquaticum]|uniref:Phage-related tail protein n=1 Tax=Methylobacterium aquaticum TaxID=270351 RepID=A0A0C6FC98_9HYPH|nr:phage tail tape measure protein [Methylobacterium aquaticum]BAQ50286.1 phage-related tail protein [Methylobacterium aquaticum]